MRKKDLSRSVFSLLFLFLLGTWSGGMQAQGLEDGKMYRVLNKAKNLAVSNGSKAENDAPIILEKEDENSLGQEWMLVERDAKQKIYVFVNPNYNKAIDMALTSKNYLLQWDVNLTNDNQAIQIAAVDEENGVYQLLNSGNTSQMAVPFESNGKWQLRMQAGSQAEDTYFTFKATRRHLPFRLPENIISSLM